jgi:hypothetical protein
MTGKVTTTTKAPVGAPPRKQREADQFKLLATIADEPTFVADNMKPKTKYKDLNFKVSDAFSREFKLTATARGQSMKELLEECFATWKKAQK